SPLSPPSAPCRILFWCADDHILATVVVSHTLASSFKRRRRPLTHHPLRKSLTSGCSGAPPTRAVVLVVCVRAPRRIPCERRHRRRLVVQRAVESVDPPVATFHTSHPHALAPFSIPLDIPQTPPSPFGSAVLLTVASPSSRIARRGTGAVPWR
ncbi:hypothetical protein DFP72DRAFT_872102, partial [Ephemerocybe angulata]